ncbi:39S ribosomal protein L54 mitochondrial, partial [Fasciolopsis buskii]
KGVAAVAKSKELPVETDPEKLVKCCCINYRVGEQPIPLKPDDEYPDWLWTLRTERSPVPLEEIDKNSYYYWRRIRKTTLRHWNQLASVAGWHRRDHRMISDHPSRFYGDRYTIASDWYEDRKFRS